MNHVIEAQVIADYVHANDSLSCHLFLENQHVPLKMQDKILVEVNRLKVSNTAIITKVIDSCF